MELTGEHNLMLTVLLEANARQREPSAGCPSGISRWHSAFRLTDESESLASWTETDVHRVGAALQRRGLATHKTQYRITRWTLTEAGLGQARRLARSAA